MGKLSIRPSIPPEQLLKALLLQALYSVIVWRKDKRQDNSRDAENYKKPPLFVHNPYFLTGHVFVRFLGRSR
jgi:hypothetical protein